MYRRSETIDDLETVLLAMKQNIAMMRGNYPLAREIQQRSHLSSDVAQFEKNTPNFDSNVQKYNAWAESFVELTVRVNKQMTAENIKALVEKGAITKNDMREIAIFLNLALETNKFDLMHYQQHLAEPTARDRYVSNLQQAIHGYLPQDAMEHKNTQIQLLESSGMGIHNIRGSLSDNIIEQRRHENEERRLNTEMAKLHSEKANTQKASRARESQQYQKSQPIKPPTEDAKKKSILTKLKDNISERFERQKPRKG